MLQHSLHNNNHKVNNTPTANSPKSTLLQLPQALPLVAVKCEASCLACELPAHHLKLLGLKEVSTWPHNHWLVFIQQPEPLRRQC